MTLITADYLLDENLNLRKGWAVKVDGSKIKAVGPSSSMSSSRWVNLGRSVIIPGLINCHNHLELTALGGMVKRTKDFVAWLDEVRDARNGKTDDYLTASAKEGVANSLTMGTTTIADHSNSGLSYKALKEMPVRAIILYELIALDKDTLKKRRPVFKKHIRKTREDELLAWGLAPHAPYSASRDLIDWAVKKCRKNNRVLSIHLHEHREEEEFLKTGSGPFREMLMRLNTKLDEFEPPGVSSTEYLESMKFLRPGALLVHSNYISPDDMKIIRNSGASIIFCPRSHHYFYRNHYPLNEMLDAGLRVALGTDSMVSNWSISILDEMRFIRKNFPDIKAKTIFEMATTAGAEALGIDKKIGRLAPKMDADIAALGNIPEKDNLDIEDLLSDDITNIFTMVSGKEVYKTTKE